MSEWVYLGSARLRKPHYGQGSPTQAVALGDPGGKTARIPLSAAEPPGAGRAWGPRGARRQLHRPGSQFRRGIGHADASFRSCSAGHGRVGVWGMPSPAPSPWWGRGGHWEPGVKMGGEPEARLGWLINTLGGIRQAGSRPAWARATKWVPVNWRAGLKGGSVWGRGLGGARLFLWPRIRSRGEMALKG